MGGGGGKPRGGFYHGYFTKGLRGSPEIKQEVAGESSKSEGTFQYCNGDVYIGQWKEGKKHGSGTYACAANGTFFSGKFRYNKPLGKGVWVFPNGNQLVGEYKQKELVGEEEAPVEEADEGAEKKDPEVECTFVYGDCVVVQGDAPPKGVKYTQMRT